MARFFALTVSLSVCLWLSGCPGDRSREMLETAQFEERQNNQAHAKELYQEIIRLYPQTPAARTARDRLAALDQGR